MKKYSKEKGITLVALVVTIIVLLILATVSISLVLGENGIVTRSKEAVLLTEISELKEAIDMKQSENRLETMEKSEIGLIGVVSDILGKQYKQYDDKYRIENSKLVYIEGAVSESIVPILEVNDVKKSSKALLVVNKSTKQTKYKNYNYIITMNDLESKITSGEISKDNYNKIYIMEDMDLGATWDEEGNLISGEEWIPISKIPEGVTLEGNNHKIKGMYINTDVRLKALINLNYGIIKNINIDENNYLKSTAFELAAICCDNNGEIVECINNAFVNGQMTSYGTSSAGIVIYNRAVIKKCINYGRIHGKYYIAGIASVSTGDVIDCVNYGGIDTISYGIAGIVGETRGGTIKRCINYADIKTLNSIGGITDVLTGKGVIEECVNYGNISGSYTCGGIATKIEKGSSIKNCYNFGNVKGSLYDMAGIAVYNNEGEISNCYNIGNVIKDRREESYSDYRINTENTGTITNCYGLNDILEDGTVVDLDYMKTEAFVNKLGSLYKQDKENKNQGYPLLSWQ